MQGRGERPQRTAAVEHFSDIPTLPKWVVERIEYVWMSLDDYKVVLYRNQPDGWVTEVPAIRGCYALMPTREEALAELGGVFDMIAAEYGQKGLPLPADSTAIVHA